MSTELLEIEPRELKFVFELKKQSSCTIQLGNKTDQHVAFKVKTTSPKKYCVRPNTGILKPNERCDFTVTMQAQRVAPPDMQCKDKFLVQGTIVPIWMTEENITSEMFSRDSGTYIEEKKMKVVLICAASSPVLLTVNGETKQDTSNETQLQKDKALKGVENIPPPLKVSEDFKGLETAKSLDELKTPENIALRPAENVDNIKQLKELEMKFAKDSEELKTKLSLMDSKLREAELTIKNLNEEKRRSTREKNILKHEVDVFKRSSNVKTVQRGFPLLYVFMVALISWAVGYHMHP